MYIENINNTNYIKVNDTATRIQLKISDNLSNPVDLKSAMQVVVVIGNRNGRILSKIPNLLDDTGVLEFSLDEGDLLEVGGNLSEVGDNLIEVHIIMPNGKKFVAPSSGHYKLRVTRSIDTLGEKVTTVTLDYFIEKVDEKIAELQDKIDYVEETREYFETHLDETVDLAVDNKMTPFVEDVNERLAQTVKKNETGVLNLNVFDEPTRAVLQGLEPGQINAVLGYKNVQIENAAFIEESSNMVYLDSLTHGYTISDSTGELVSNSLHSVSDFISVVPSSSYTSANIARRAFYDESKNFISSKTGNGTFQTPENAKFIRVVVHDNHLNTAQLNFGSTLLPYEPGHPPRLSKEIEVDCVGSEEIEEIRTLATEALNDVETLKTEGIEPKENSVGIEHLKFVKRSSNLFNAADVIDGYTIDTTTGELTPNSVNSVSGFIPVKGNTDYSRAFVNRIAYYDADKKFISSSTNPSSITTPSNAAFVRLIASTASLGKTQFNEGSALLPYEPYYVQLEGVSVRESETDILFENYYVQKLDGDEVYTAELQSDVSVGSPNNLKELLHSDINDLYAELAVNHPNYVTKQLLGTEATGREIYRYDFKPSQTDKNGVKIPKVFITAGTHGSEKTAVWVTYQMVKALCESWESNEILENLRWNVHLIIIPLLNPWGWDYITEASGNRTGTRKNSNGVDLARNFPTGWTLGSDPTSATYGGTAPLSEPEAQYANAILEAEKDNLIYVCDFHNFFTRNGSIWNAAATDYQINLGEHLVRHMSRKWKKEHAFMPQDNTTMVGYSDKSAPNGSLGKHATSFGIHGGTFEVSEYCPWEADGTGAINSPLAIKFGMESFINWLGLVVKNSIIHLQ